jgi:polysaccharide biosynthesis protein PslH
MTTRHDVTLLALAWNDEDHQALNEWKDRCVAVHALPHSGRPRIQFGANFFRQPLQYTVSRSTSFANLARDLIRQAERKGSPCDVVHVEHMRGAAAIDMLRPLGIRTVFDAVDCLAELARLTRTHGPNPMVRALAGYEHSRTRRMESLLVQSADAVTVVAERDRRALVHNGGMNHVMVIPNGVDILSQPLPVRSEPSAVFTGKLSYHANQAAVRWLISDIWPRVRRIIPDATLSIAGADPPTWIVKHDGDNGIQIIPNPRDMSIVLASSRVAVAPIVYSVGVQNKVLEAMATGLPVVATPSAMEGLLPQSHGCLATAADANQFALTTASLLADDLEAQRIGIAGYDYVSMHHTWTSVAHRFEDLYRNDRQQQRAA